MCCCGKPVINGQLGYRWQPNDTPSVRPVAPPPLEEGDVMLYDEPGRCGGIDSHCHHYRLVKRHGHQYDLLCENGGGTHCIDVSLYGKQIEIFATMDSNARYWLFNAIYHAYRDGERKATDNTSQYWRKAAAEKRIKTRKVRGSDSVKVWVEDRMTPVS